MKLLHHFDIPAYGKKTLSLKKKKTLLQVKTWESRENSAQALLYW